MEKNTAAGAQNGINEKILKEISAQIAILDCARNLINQHLQRTERNNDNTEKGKCLQGSGLNQSLGPWIYNMEQLENFLAKYTAESQQEERIQHLLSESQQKKDETE